MTKKKNLHLEWVEIDIKDWYLNHKDKVLFVVSGSDTPISHGYFKGYESLSKEQLIEFEESPECFYYNSMRCQKKTDEDEECECYMGREFSSLTVEPLCIEDDDIFIKVIRPMMEYL